MRLWLSKNSEIPLREQLTLQIILAIVSGDLPKNAKLPSVRELALRHSIHQNTVSSAYRQLEEEGLLEARKGSGVFVREIAEAKRQTIFDESTGELDKLIYQFLQNAQQKGFSEINIKTRLAKFFSRNMPEKIVIVENDIELRRILASEICAEIEFPIVEMSIEDLSVETLKSNMLIVALPETAEKIQPFLSLETQTLTLKVNSVQEELRGQQRPSNDDLIGLISHWEVFRIWSKTILIAAGIEGESLIIRNAKDKNPLKGLSQCAFVIADSFTAQSLAEIADVRVFRLIAKESLAELKTKTVS